MEVLWQMRAKRRLPDPHLPETVTRLSTHDGSVVYLVGTAHFSDNSKNDVATVGVLFGVLLKIVEVFVVG